MSSAVTGQSVEMIQLGENNFQVCYRQPGAADEWQNNLSASGAHVVFKQYAEIIIERQDEHFEQLKHQQ